MGNKLMLLGALVGLGVCVDASAIARAPPRDPCATIGGQKWVSPTAVRDCFTSIKVNETLKSNIIEVISKTLPFHTSVNYQIRAPAPFTQDVHEDLFADLARISKQRYPSDYDLHIDLSRTLKRLNDGHCVWANRCYVSLFINYLPLPLSLLTDASGQQSVHIAPEAFSVASAEFPDQIDVWQNALPGKLKGQLASLAGAKVLLINGRNPNAAIDANAAITGGFQGLGTRQNSFFSSYQAAASGWTYSMGNFAQQALPLDNQVVLTIQRTGSKTIETVTIPYRSRFAGSAFTDTASLLQNNCRARAATNGVDIDDASGNRSPPAESPVSIFQQQGPISASDARKHRLNVILDTTPLSDVVLPSELVPKGAVSGSRNAAQFFLLDDNKTGVLALGSFSDSDYDAFLQSLLQGLLNLKSVGATQLVVDVSNNGGGFICAAHWLHRIIAGPKATTVPQAGLDTTTRAGPLARQIVQDIVTNNRDPNVQLLYNPRQWRNASNEFFGENEDWLSPAVNKTINGRSDAFSQKLGQECQPEGFPSTAPPEALFDPKKVVIVSNGRCASSCSLFSITMKKLEGSQTVVLGGRKSVQQQYCGVVGGQSTDFATIDTEIKSTKLKNSPLAPPDLLVNGVQGIAWRLGFGIDNPAEPEEWQTHSADLNLPLTPSIVNNPVAIWKEVIARLL